MKYKYTEENITDHPLYQAGRDYWVTAAAGITVDSGTHIPLWEELDDSTQKLIVGDLAEAIGKTITKLMIRGGNLGLR
jgi:hypothetical protein